MEANELNREIALVIFKASITDQFGISYTKDEADQILPDFLGQDWERLEDALKAKRFILRSTVRDDRVDGRDYGLAIERYHNEQFTPAWSWEQTRKEARKVSLEKCWKRIVKEFE